MEIYNLDGLENKTKNIRKTLRFFRWASLVMVFLEALLFLATVVWFYLVFVAIFILFYHIFSKEEDYADETLEDINTLKGLYDNRL